ncbi:MAG: hypothetical protein QOF76_5631 [Solirubrobacteraceae bacterium]|nr:hypothetical protein [Solirubrobacteraceae bacterium]
MTNDGSRIEAAEAGVHTEQEEHGAHDHVDAPDAVSPAHHAPAHTPGGHGTGHGSAHDDDHGAHGGHGADPNAGVLRGDPPTPAWVWTATLVGFLTIGLCVLLALKIG